MPTPKPAPDLKIPHSEHTVGVSIIDTTVRMSGIPTAAFTQPTVGGYSALIGGVAYAFLIKHRNPDIAGKHDTLLWDLGVRKDLENSSKAVIDLAMAMGFQMDVKKDVIDILRDEGADPAEVGGIIWSHYHVVSQIEVLLGPLTVGDSKTGPHRQPSQLSQVHRFDRWTRIQGCLYTGMAHQGR